MTGMRVRRSDDVLMPAIRAAVLAELADHGYGGVSFEGVARRVQTSKPVLYRRYRTRAQMVLDAISQSEADQHDVRKRGSLRADLIAALERMAADFERFPAEVYRGLIGEVDDSLVDDAMNALGAVNSQTMSAILDNARTRGEIGSGRIPERVVLLPMSLLRHELLFNQPFDPTTITDIVDQVSLPLLRTVGLEKE